MVTPDQVEMVLQRTFDAAQQQSAQLIIDALVAELAAHTGLSYEIAQYVETVSVTAGAPVFLATRPVRSVESVTASGELLDLSSVMVRGWGIEHAFTSGVVEVTYTAGTEPDALVDGLVLRVAAREMAAVLGDTVGILSMTVEGTRQDYVRVTGFTADELAKVKRRRKVGVA
jgi:hypothetical protein